MRVAVTFGAGQINKDRADPYGFDFKAVTVTMNAHQIVGRAMLVLIGKLELLLMHRDTASIHRPTLGLLRRRVYEQARSIFAGVLNLLYAPHMNSRFERPGHT